MPRQDKSIIRVDKNSENPFVMIDNRIFSDERISWEAKGLLGYCLSRPDNWTIRIGDLVKRSTSGRDAVYRIINELRAYGYMSRDAIRGETGRIEGWIYVAHERSIGVNEELLKEQEEKKAKAKARRESKKQLPEIQEVVTFSNSLLPENPEVVKPDLENTDISNTNFFSNNDLTNKDKKHDHVMGDSVESGRKGEQHSPQEVERLRATVEEILGDARISRRVFRDIAARHDSAYIIDQARTVAAGRDRIKKSVAGAFVRAIESDWAGLGYVPASEITTTPSANATTRVVEHDGKHYELAADQDERYIPFYVSMGQLSPIEFA